jgi:sirohydrochlorin ferrochelatase
VRGDLEQVVTERTGTIRATIGDQTEEASAGDVILVPAGSRLGVDNLTDEPGDRLGHHQRRLRWRAARRLLDQPTLDPLSAW